MYNIYSDESGWSKTTGSALAVVAAVIVDTDKVDIKDFNEKWKKEISKLNLPELKWSNIKRSRTNIQTAEKTLKDTLFLV